MWPYLILAFYIIFSKCHIYVKRRFCFALLFMRHIELVLIDLLPFNESKFSHLKVVLYCAVLCYGVVLRWATLCCIHTFWFWHSVWVHVYSALASLFNKLSKSLTLNTSTDRRNINFKVLMNNNFIILNEKTSDILSVCLCLKSLAEVLPHAALGLWMESAMISFS